MCQLNLYIVPKNVSKEEVINIFEKQNTDVLKLAKEIYIYPFWQDGEPLEIKGERQVRIRDLNIEDSIFLPYKNLLQIKAISK